MKELDDGAEIRPGRASSHAVEVADVGASVRMKDTVPAADPDRALRISGVQGELGRRLFDQRHEELARNPDPRPVDIGPRRLPQVQGFIVGELDADLFDDGHRRLVDQGDALRIQQLVDRNLTDQGRVVNDGRAHP